MNRTPTARRAVHRALVCAALMAAGTGSASETPRAPGADGAPAAAPPTPPRGIAAALEGPRLVGQGLLRWFGLRVYDATLWSAGRRFDPARPLEFAFALELRYLRALEGSAIAQASVREMARMGLGSAAQHETWLQQMRTLFPNVGDGDRLAGIHRPGKGAEFLGNDAPIGRIDDPEFARAFFSIWLDPRTSAPELRRALIAGAGSRTDPER